MTGAPAVVISVTDVPSVRARRVGAAGEPAVNDALHLAAVRAAVEGVVALAEGGGERWWCRGTSTSCPRRRPARARGSHARTALVGDLDPVGARVEPRDRGAVGVRERDVEAAVRPDAGEEERLLAARDARHERERPERDGEHGPKEHGAERRRRWAGPASVKSPVNAARRLEAPTLTHTGFHPHLDHVDAQSPRQNDGEACTLRGATAKGLFALLNVQRRRSRSLRGST